MPKTFSVEVPPISPRSPLHQIRDSKPRLPRRRRSLTPNEEDKDQHGCSEKGEYAGTLLSLVSFHNNDQLNPRPGKTVQTKAHMDENLLDLSDTDDETDDSSDLDEHVESLMKNHRAKPTANRNHARKIKADNSKQVKADQEKRIRMNNSMSKREIMDVLKGKKLNSVSTRLSKIGNSKKLRVKVCIIKKSNQSIHLPQQASAFN